MNGILLVIDDDQYVREALADIFDVLGVDATCVASGTEGVALFAARRREVEAVILDVNLRGMTSRHALTQLKEIDPGVKVILSSGYDEEEVMRRFPEREVAGFLPKPYTVNSLQAGLCAILDE